jgi:hypothetical protein
MYSRLFTPFIVGLVFSVSSGFASSETSFDYEFITESITAWHVEGIRIDGCQGCGTEVVIPEKIGDENVIEIGFQAFKDSNVHSVSLPSSLKTIGAEAFANNNITTLNLLYGNVSIGEAAFSNNPITHIYVCDDMWGSVPGEEIIWQPYNNCPAKFNYREIIPGQSDDGIAVTGCQNDCQSELVIPEYIDGNQVVSIYANAFVDEGISSVSFPDSLMHIEYRAFSGNQLASVSFPEGLRSIGDNAFASNQIQSVNIPNSVNSIGSYAFYQNTISDITIPNSVNSIGSYAFYQNTISDITIPDSIEFIADGTFYSNQLTSITLSENLAIIGYDAFSNNQLTSVDIPNGVTEIKEGAFSNNGLTTISIPDTVINNEFGAFSGNPGLAESGFRYFILSENATLLGCDSICPNDLIIPENVGGYPVTSIQPGAFESSQINSVQFPNTMEIIGRSGFYDNQITSLVLPSRIEIIGSGAFEYNPLTNVSFLGNLPDEIGEYVFSGNDTLGHNIFYCSGATGWPGDTFEGVSAQEDESCNIINDQSGITHYSTFDIDQNGSFDALTDGLILLRYAFGLTGDNLINGVISPDANRTSAADIEAYIESHMP